MNRIDEGRFDFVPKYLWTTMSKNNKDNLRNYRLYFKYLNDNDKKIKELEKELSDKKIFLNDKLCLYIIKRIKRNYKSISHFTEALDIISLEEKKKITLKQIKEVLNIIEA